jgi:mono/diheme cytochrome c family protein
MRSLRSNLKILKGPAVRLCIWGGIALCLALLAGCQQEMAQQPQHKPLAASAFFADGRSARDLVPGTVARGQEQEAASWSLGSASGEAMTTLPLPLTHDLLARGQERYNIVCTPCHDRVGTGHGMIVRRGYPRPPSFHIPRLRQAPIGHLFAVMSDGYGAMPAYGDLVTPSDRWAIAAYVRALQLSQYAPVAELPVEMRAHLKD